ncbi:hypothetical protein BDW60DRAFT_185928 [Aspergillus nidulans var. acristatus]
MSEAVLTATGNSATLPYKMAILEHFYTTTTIISKIRSILVGIELITFMLTICCGIRMYTQTGKGRNCINYTNVAY